MRFTGTFLTLARFLPLALVTFSALASANAVPEPAHDIAFANELSDGYDSNTPITKPDEENHLHQRSPEPVTFESYLSESVIARDVQDDEDDGKGAFDALREAIAIAGRLKGLHHARALYDDDDEYDKEAFIGKLIQKIFGKSRSTTPSPPGTPRPDSPTLGPWGNRRRSFMDEMDEEDKEAFIGKLIQKIFGKSRSTTPSPPGTPRPDSPTLGPWGNRRRSLIDDELEDEEKDAFIGKLIQKLFGKSRSTTPSPPGTPRPDSPTLGPWGNRRRSLFDDDEEFEDFDKDAFIGKLIQKLFGKNKSPSPSPPGTPRPDSPTLGPWGNRRRSLFDDDEELEDFDKDAFIGKLIEKLFGKNKSPSPSPPGTPRPDSPTLGPWGNRRRSLFADDEEDFDKDAFIGKLIQKLFGKNKSPSPSPPGTPRPDSPTLGPWGNSRRRRALQDQIYWN